MGDVLVSSFQNPFISQEFLTRMKLLHLTLHKKWFDEILSGTKKIEYRDVKPYWTKRLFNEDGTPKNFDFIIFSNGYSKDCRKMKVEFKGIKKQKDKYEIMLGRVIVIEAEAKKGEIKLRRKSD